MSVEYRVVIGYDDDFPEWPKAGTKITLPAIGEILITKTEISYKPFEGTIEFVLYGRP